MINKVLFRNGKKYYWQEGELQTDAGVLKDLEKAEGLVKAHSGKEFIVMNANFLDNIDKMKRGPQAMLEKDIGVIMVNLGLGKASVVLEGGVGSGKMSLFLSRICKKVYSYEVDEGNYNLAKKNLEDVNNVDLKLSDVKDVKEKDFDACILDVPNPWECLKEVSDSLKNGGSLCVYVPTVTQVIRLMKEIEGLNLVKVKTVEILEREWYTEGLKVRPKSENLNTVFLSFFRKY